MAQREVKRDVQCNNFIEPSAEADLESSEGMWPSHDNKANPTESSTDGNMAISSYQLENP